MFKRIWLYVAAALVCPAVLAGAVAAAEQAAEVAKGSKPGTKEKVKWAPAVEPKPLSENVKRGLDWLAAHQLDSGGWGQGEESAAMGGAGKLKDVPSMADTCVAALALIRAGNTPQEGEHLKSLRKALAYVCAEIEKSDQDSLSVTNTRGTRVQSKLGPYIDTFMASLLLSEVQEKITDEALHKRVSSALNKVLAKMEKNQRKDGTWANQGWAPTIAQGIAVKGLNRAAQSGTRVAPQTLARAEDKARKSFDAASGEFSKEGSAGVALYSAGASVSALSDSVNTNAAREADVKEQLKNAKTDQERRQAEAVLQRFDRAKADLQGQQDAIIRRLDDKQFIAGFGSNGGEEFLSYMNIGESLVVKGGDAWKAWDKSISQNLNRIQNQDGSWTGHHCITGRTFCTSSALLVLMVDRTPVPIAAKMKRR